VLANRGVTIGGKGGTIAGALNNYGGAESLREAPKNPKNVISAFFNTVHLLPKDLRFEHVGARVVARMSQQGGLKITRGAHCYIQCWMYAATATKKSLVACKVHSHLFRPRKLYRYERRTCWAPSFDVLQPGQGKRQEIAYFANSYKLLSACR